MKVEDRPPTSTLCVHGGDRPDPATGAVEPPLHLASAFAFDDAEQAAGAFRGENEHFIYGRWGNPTVDALEEKLAMLEGSGAPGVAACATASGMAAIAATLLTLCETGDAVVAPRSMYGESARLLRERLPRLGIETTFVDQSDPSSYERAIGPRTKVLYVETPANPMLTITDLAAVVAIARKRGLTVVADNTFATPYCQRPLSHGVDLVVHSMTKAIGGHGDAIGGAVIGDSARIRAIKETAIKTFGGVLAPFNALLISRGVRTFALRARQSCATALALAQALERHPRVRRVFYPGLPSHPGHAVAARQMSSFGALVAFEVESLAVGRAVLEGCRVVTHAVSLGDVRSLVTHPASTTHASMPAEARVAAGIADGLLRVSCGIEETEDVVADVVGALDQATSAPSPREAR
ncbi:MAG: PLP-dependent transferase [Deltaproteobacteria bacterium]|nr:PLP-dependent transferase [Deltaproteobacteria bacterium]